MVVNDSLVSGTPELTGDTLYDTIPNLSENSQYQWLVVAYSGSGDSYSNSDTCYTACSNPSGLGTDLVTHNSVSLFCNSFANDTIGSSGYFFSLKKSEALIDSSNSDDSTHIFNSLMPESSYVAYVYYMNGDSIRTDSMYSHGYDSVPFTTTPEPIPFFPHFAFILFAILICLVTVSYLRNTIDSTTKSRRAQRTRRILVKW